MPAVNKKFDPLAHTFRSSKFASVVKEAIEFFEQTPVSSLPPSIEFSAGGVYALYYIGSYPLYTRLAETNHAKCCQPIYVGKAVLPGWRTARTTNKAEAKSLYSRLREHARSLESTTDLSSDDFRVRFMILEGVESDLVVPIEAELIRRHKPIWNHSVDGFGNHDPGKGRYEQAPSEWDVLHPGRSWAKRLKGTPPDIKSIQDKIRKFFI